MRIDGRPVLIMYLTREYFKTRGFVDALSAARTTIEQQFGYDPYIIGDDFFGSGAVNASRAAQFDAITNFDVYGTSFGSGIVNQARVNQLANIYANAKTRLSRSEWALSPPCRQDSTTPPSVPDIHQPRVSVGIRTIGAGFLDGASWKTLCCPTLIQASTT